VDLFEKDKQDAEHHRHLSHPEDEHPFDDFGFGFGYFVVELPNFICHSFV